MDSPVCLSYCFFLVEIFIFSRAGPSLLIVILDGILLLRVFALYDRSKRGVFEQIFCIYGILRRNIPVLIILSILVIGEYFRK